MRGAASTERVDDNPAGGVDAAGEDQRAHDVLPGDGGSGKVGIYWVQAVVV